MSDVDWRPRIAWKASLDDLWDAAISAAHPCH